MPTENSVFFRLQQEGWHNYPQAKNYLNYRHRHMFHIDVEAQVAHNNREIEFIEAKADFAKFLSGSFPNSIEGHGCDFKDMSCEQIAYFVVDYLLATYETRDYWVTVSEDGENGARVRYSPHA